MTGIERRERTGPRGFGLEDVESERERRVSAGDCQSDNLTMVYLRRKFTGVRSLSSSVADVAASIKSSHLLPYNAAVLGSAEGAFLSWFVGRR